MRAGAFLRRFTASDGREVIIRTPEWDDLDDMLEFINSLVEEEAMIAANQKQTRESEIEWLARNLANLEKGRHIAWSPRWTEGWWPAARSSPRPGRMSHVGCPGHLREGRVQGDRHRPGAHEGGGEARGRQWGSSSIILEVFAINERAIHVYEKMGYRRIGAIPGGVKYRGEYVDAVSMYKRIAG